MIATRLRPVASALAAAALLVCTAAAHADPSQAELMKLLQQFNDRLEKLEKRNAELEKQVHGGRAPPAVEIEQRVKVLEQNNAKIDKGLESENISENEPDLTSRLKAVEYHSLGMLKQARMVQSLDGITAGVSLTTVAQKPNETPAGSPLNNSQLNYRGDVEALGPSVAAVTAPPDAAPTPLRPRPLVDRQILLDGLVTPPSPAR